MKISYSEIENYCNELHRLSIHMKNTLNNLKTISKKIDFSNVWEGQAADNFVTKLNDLPKNFDEVFVELENSILYLANCAEGYKAIDRQVIKEICENLNITDPNLSTSKIY